MARIAGQAGAYSIEAESLPERALIAHGAEHGGQVVLLEAFYGVQDGRVLLPAGISGERAQRICRALEEASRSHVEAERRRRDFRLVNGG